MVFQTYDPRLSDHQGTLDLTSPALRQLVQYPRRNEDTT